MRPKAQPTGPTTFRPLTKDEIDRRIDQVIEMVAAPDAESAEADLRPRWISAGELVRRLRPFVSLN